MISKGKIRDILNTAAKRGEPIFNICEDGESLFDVATGEPRGTIDQFAQVIRKQCHCDFEVLYDDALNNVHYRCRECGTVIFASDNEECCDDNLCCPTCGGYETHFKYWTKEEINNDQEKQNAMNFYQGLMEDRRKAYDRGKRTGLYFNELWKRTFENEDTRLTIILTCNDALKTGLKGLTLRIEKDKKDDDGWFARKWSKHIPIAPRAMYIHWVYPYTKKCNASLRKYFPWQKDKNSNYGAAQLS